LERISVMRPEAQVTWMLLMMSRVAFERDATKHLKCTACGSVGFVGKTCLLRKGPIHIPSDLHGVIYIEMDNAEGWHKRLARELREAGLEFDVAKLL
jgi:hypothetical protein